MKTFFIRLGVGLVVLIVTLFVAFAWAVAQIPSWGATPAEVALVLPGDELAPKPLLNWTNAIEINAPQNKYGRGWRNWAIRGADFIATRLLKTEWAHSVAQRVTT